MQTRLVATTASILLSISMAPVNAIAWGNDGHEIIAWLQSRHLNPDARDRVATLLEVDQNLVSVAPAMAAAAIKPDNEFKQIDPASARWHFINICLQDKRTDLPARCVDGQCVPARINYFWTNLSRQTYDRWGAAGDLAFLIHLVGDLHQPPHCATNADQGGSCDRVGAPAGFSTMHNPGNLHLIWNVGLVRQAELELGSNGPAAAASALDVKFEGPR